MWSNQRIDLENVLLVYLNATVLLYTFAIMHCLSISLFLMKHNGKRIYWLFWISKLYNINKSLLKLMQVIVKNKNNYNSIIIV